MNSILQPLLANNQLMLYFFTEQHSGCDGANHCLACEVDSLVQNIYNQSPVPFNPHTFLHAFWINSPHFACYDQHDAHEFFMAFFDLLHSKCPNDNCCIMHKIFSGKLRSDIICGKCGKLSSKTEQIIDVSLQIADPNGPTITLLTKSKKKVVWASGDILSCLQRYVKPEILAAKEQMFCSQCSANTDCTKQLSFLVLPNVLVIHLKVLLAMYE